MHTLSENSNQRVVYRNHMGYMSRDYLGERVHVSRLTEAELFLPSSTDLDGYEKIRILETRTIKVLE